MQSGNFLKFVIFLLLLIDMVIGFVINKEEKMDLKKLQGWSAKRIALGLDVNEKTVDRWLNHTRYMVMRGWE